MMRFVLANGYDVIYDMYRARIQGVSSCMQNFSGCDKIDSLNKSFFKVPASWLNTFFLKDYRFLMHIETPCMCTCVSLDRLLIICLR